MSHYPASPCNPEDLDTKNQIHAGQWGTALGRAEESTAQLCWVTSFWSGFRLQILSQHRNQSSTLIKQQQQFQHLLRVWKIQCSSFATEMWAPKTQTYPVTARASSWRCSGFCERNRWGWATGDGHLGHIWAPWRQGKDSLDSTYNKVQWMIFKYSLGET